MPVAVIVDRGWMFLRYRPCWNGKHFSTSTTVLCKDALWVAGRARARIAVLMVGNVVHGAGPGAL